MSFILGLASAVGLICLVRLRRGERGSLNLCQSVIARRYGIEKAQRLIAAVRQRRTELLAAASLPQNPALRWHLTANILPGLALYQVLLQEHRGGQAAALAEVDEALRPWTLAKNRARFALLRLTPAPFSVFKLVFAQTMKQFPAGGGASRCEADPGRPGKAGAGQPQTGRIPPPPEEGN